MIWLILGILCASLLFVIFRLFQKWNIDTFQAIVVNYIVASIAGFIFSQNKSCHISETIYQSWFYMSLLLGSMFIGVFYLMAISSQRAGISVTSVAAKMSLIIPILAGIYIYAEYPDTPQWIGIVLAIPAIILTIAQKEKTSNRAWYLPVAIFIASGIIDTLVTYSQNKLVAKNDFPMFSALLFSMAAVWGLLFYIIFVRSKINIRNVIGGIILGIPNYFSIYFLLSALESEVLLSGTTVAVNNIGVVMVSALTGIIFMGETLGVKNIIGILLAIGSILLISL